MWDPKIRWSVFAPTLQSAQMPLCTLLSLELLCSCALLHSMVCPSLEAEVKLPVVHKEALIGQPKESGVQGLLPLPTIYTPAAPILPLAVPAQPVEVANDSKYDRLLWYAWLIKTHPFKLSSHTMACS